MTEVISRHEQGSVGGYSADHVVELGQDLPEMTSNRLQRLRRTAAACGCLILTSLTLAATNARSNNVRPPAYTPASSFIQRDFPVPVRCYKTDFDFYVAEGRNPNDPKNNPHDVLAGFYGSQSNIYPVDSNWSNWDPALIVGFSPDECIALNDVKNPPLFMFLDVTAAAEYVRIHELKHATGADTTPNPACRTGDIECQADCQTAKTYSEHLYRDGFRGRKIFNLLTYLAQHNAGYDPQKTRRCWPVWFDKKPVTDNITVTAVTAELDPKFK